MKLKKQIRFAAEHLAEANVAMANMEIILREKGKTDKADALKPVITELIKIRRTIQLISNKEDAGLVAPERGFGMDVAAMGGPDPQDGAEQ